ncbi:MAG TPA: outer membrane lipoprotein-sorting protein [Bacteroidales bacterium]|nr:outer membrane lipoprotein-sorting protein [Bacteroidales bacterium]
MKTIKFTVISGLLILLSFSAKTQPSGKEILDRIDRNMSSETRYYEARMIIHGSRGNRTIEFNSWSEGDTKAFTEYTNPVRERGTKMLKLEDKLWIYSPGTDRTIQIIGHMLKQSVMGSDLSYEDVMEDTKLTDIYDSEITGTEYFNDTECYIVDLVANNPDIAYQMRKIWVDKNRYVPLKEELYAKSGKLLKRTELSMIEQIEERWYPRNIVFKDMLKRGGGTEFIVDKIDFNIEIPEHLLSKAALR